MGWYRWYKHTCMIARRWTPGLRPLVAHGSGKRVYTLSFNPTPPLNWWLTIKGFQGFGLQQKILKPNPDTFHLQFTNVRGVRIAEFSAIPSELETCPKLDQV